MKSVFFALAASYVTALSLVAHNPANSEEVIFPQLAEYMISLSQNDLVELEKHLAQLRHEDIGEQLEGAMA